MQASLDGPTLSPWNSCLSCCKNAQFSWKNVPAPGSSAGYCLGSGPWRPEVSRWVWAPWPALTTCASSLSTKPLD